jgi:hypothetical protein
MFFFCAVFGAGNCEVPAGTSNYNNAFGIQDKYMKVPLLSYDFLNVFL